MSFPPEPTNDAPVNNEGISQDNSSQDSINPAWNDVLKLVPETLHSQLIPHFKNWDKGVQDRFQQVHSKYEPYKQFEPFLESQVSPDDLRMGYGLLQAVYQKPTEVIKAIQDTFGLTQQQAEALVEQGGAETEESNSDPYAQIPPQFMEEFMRMKQQTELQGKILLEQRNQEIQAQQIQAVTDTVNGLKTKYGNFDEQTEFAILTMAQQLGGDIDKAAEQFFSLIEQQIAARNRPKPPVLLGSNNGPIPENAVDPRKLSDRDTRNLVAEMLKRAAQEK